MAEQSLIKQVWQIGRIILEEIGVLESTKAQMQNRVRQLSSMRPRGAASVLVQAAPGRRKNMVGAVRQVSGLSIQEAGDFLTLLPAPLLIHVDEKTAVTARDILTKRGLTVKVVGVPVKAIKIDEADLSPSPEDQLASISQPTTKAGDAIAALPKANWPDAPTLVTGEGEYVVVLQRPGLLEARIERMLPQVANLTPGMATKLMTVLPQPILIGVDQETAHKAQSQLQMFGAVVEVLLWEIYEKELE